MTKDGLVINLIWICELNKEKFIKVFVLSILVLLKFFVMALILKFIILLCFSVNVAILMTLHNGNGIAYFWSQVLFFAGSQVPNPFASLFNLLQQD